MKNILITMMFVLAGVGLAYADLENLGKYEKAQFTLSTGYYWVETEDNSARAKEYSYQDVSGTAAFNITHYVDEKNFKIDGRLLNENDFAFIGDFNHGTKYRLNLRFEKMFHNLDHIDYESRPEDLVGTNLTGAASISNTSKVLFSDQNPGEDYSLKIDTSEVTARFKLPDMRAHASVGYWRYHKDGEKQLRFVDKGNADGVGGAGTCAGCHMQSKTKEIDRTTHQITGAVDAHLGKFDLIAKHTYREISIDEPIPTDDFGGIFGSRRASGNYQHDAEPESQLNESTIELHSSLAGGLNLAASGTFGKRKNNSQVTTAAPISAETEYYKAAIDVNHIPSSRFSYNFRARYLDMDADNTFPEPFDVFTTVIETPTNREVDVRPPIDLSRAVYELNTTTRPSRKVSYIANLKLEQIKRTETGPPGTFSSSVSSFDNDEVWEVPEEELLIKTKIGFFARPIADNKLRVNGHYSYQHSDDPAYGASFEDSHQLFLATTHSVRPNWGFNLSAQGVLETNDNQPISAPGSSTVLVEEVDRERQQQSVNLGTWFILGEGVTAGLNYGYARTAITQDLRWRNRAATDFIDGTDDIDYLQEVNTVNGSLSFPLLANAKASLNAYYTRSIAFYDPEFSDDTYLTVTAPAPPVTIDSTGLKSASQYDIDQYGVKASIDYYFTPDFELALDYSYDDYNEKYTNDLDGSVQTAMANLAYRF